MKRRSKKLNGLKKYAIYDKDNKLVARGLCTNSEIFYKRVSLEKFNLRFRLLK